MPLDHTSTYIHMCHIISLIHYSFHASYFISCSIHVWFIFITFVLQRSYQVDNTVIDVPCILKYCTRILFVVLQKGGFRAHVSRLHVFICREPAMKCMKNQGLTNLHGNGSQRQLALFLDLSKAQEVSFNGYKWM